jgi:mannose-1-phosphate guanylyltransferase
MYALLFAGGVGQRLWPISRKNTPKQFSPLVESKSSLQLAVERLGQIVPKENIYVSANKRYSDLLAHQVGGVPETNFILEPVRRDLAAAVAFAFFKIQKKGIRGPIIFQWADNYIRHNEQLFRAINVGKELINDNPNRVVFLGEVPRFASENLGYIEHGDEIGCIEGVPYYSFRSWAYRPNLETCREMLKAGNYLWNAGYFVTTVEFIVSQYRRLAPEITQIVEEILSYEDTPDADHKLDELYPKLPAMHFDESFLMKLRPEQAVLLKVNLGWSDPGNLYSLKEALQTSQDSNVTRGEVVTLNTIDSLVINEEDGKTVSAMGLQGVMIVNTPDVLLVIAKDSVRHVRLLLDELEKSGKDDIL